jgi:hypothetical protein
MYFINSHKLYMNLNLFDIKKKLLYEALCSWSVPTYQMKNIKDLENRNVGFSDWGEGLIEDD